VFFWIKRTIIHDENQKNKLEYDQYVAFINRETELNHLRKFVNKEPSEMKTDQATVRDFVDLGIKLY